MVEVDGPAARWGGKLRSDHPAANKSRRDAIAAAIFFSEFTIIFGRSSDVDFALQNGFSFG